MAGRIAVSAYSGGLDSTLIPILLEERYGFDRVISVLVDVGQGEEEVRIAYERAKALNLELRFFDAKTEFVKDYIHRCIKANGSYEGYPMGTSMTRILIATKTAQVAREVGAEAVSHGCTGKGNDQFRMEATSKYIFPDVRVIAPVRELNLSRAEEEDMLRKHGIEPKKPGGKLGGDVNMWSHSIGSGQIEDLFSQYPADYMWAVPIEEAPDTPARFTIIFEQGVPVEADGVTDPVEIILHLNELGGKHGVGRIDMIEDGLLSLKSRELYEAPAAAILLKTHADLEHVALTKDQLRTKKDIDHLWSYIVYHAMWLHPLRRDLDAFIDSTQRWVSGKVEIKLYKGNVEILKREPKHSLFAPELRSIKRAGFDQREAEGAVKLFALPFRLYSEKGM